MKEKTYEYKVYPAACFYIPEGWYTLRDVEEMAQACKEMHAKAAEALRQSAQPSKGETV